MKFAKTTCAVARQHLKPAPSEDIARAILAEMLPRLDDRMAEAVKAVRAKT